MAAVNLMWSAYQIRAGIVKSIGVRGVVRGEATTKIRRGKKKKETGRRVQRLQWKGNSHAQGGNWAQRNKRNNNVSRVVGEAAIDPFIII